MQTKNTPTILLPVGHELLAEIDTADAEDVLRFKWYAVHRGQTWYAVRSLTKSHDERRGVEYLHRRILQPPSDLGVDHINGNGLDCRRENLRLASQQQNVRNQMRLPRNTSGFKGVYWDKPRKRWRSYIVVDKRQIHLGRFETAEEAAQAYDKAARRLFGEFARLNFGHRS